MGRFEKQPDNPRVRGDLSRSAENALWAVVEDLENLQQHVIRSMQEEIKRLQAEKNRLADDIQQLNQEKEQLQQVRQITEQQVLIRQLSEALAKHISSQLQSSLATLANKTIEQESSERAALKSAQINSPLEGAKNENIGKLIDDLDDSLTITFNSLQQELKNYQSNISQQLSRMHNQQQQGEVILTELINRLQGLEKTGTKISPPVVLQPPAEKVIKVSPTTVLQPPDLRQNNPLAGSPNLGEVASKTNLEPTTPSPEIPPLPPVKPDDIEPIFISRNLSPREPNLETTTPSAEIPPLPPVKPDDIEPIYQSRDLSPRENNLEPITPSAEIPPLPPVKPDDIEPIYQSRDLSPRENNLEPESIVRSPQPEKSSFFGLSPIQIGFLLIVLSTVMSSLYNVAIKVMFFQGSQILGLVDVERLLSPTLGNVLFILMLRLLVVVPLMLLLAPMMHPRVWQDLQNIFDSFRGNPNPANPVSKKVLQLSIASGCFLFLSQVLVYLAIAEIPTGMAIALFFVYPLISGFLSWFLFRDRPNLFRTVAIGALFCGELLILGGSSISIDNLSFGGSTAILSGAAFAVYVVLTRICASNLHPVSFTLINFATMLFLSFIGLMIPLPGEWSLVIDSSKLLEIILTAFILGVLTLCGYIFNNVGIHKLGASRSAIIGAGVPILTVIFAGLIIQENLEIIQILGVLLVTFGAAAFSLEKMRNLQSSNSPN